MDPKEFFEKAVSHATGCVKEVRSDNLTNLTPCSEWNLKELLNHMVYELLWMPELLQGKTVTEVGEKFDGDVLGDDPQAAWQEAAGAALQVVETVDLDAPTHLSYADVPARRYITEMAGEILIHGWDLGQSLKCSVIFEKPVAEAAYNYFSTNIKSYRDGGFVGKPIKVAEEVSLQVKLLAMMGRHDRD